MNLTRYCQRAFGAFEPLPGDVLRPENVTVHNEPDPLVSHGDGYSRQPVTVSDGAPEDAEWVMERQAQAAKAAEQALFGPPVVTGQGDYARRWPDDCDGPDSPKYAAALVILIGLVALLALSAWAVWALACWIAWVL